MDGPTFSLVVPSEMRMLSVARGFVDAACEAYQLNREIRQALMIVTGEAITNIVRHAHNNRAGSQIEIHLHIQAECVMLVFTDQGTPFDLSTVPELPPGELRIGGRGVYLMRTLMDELTCEPREGQCGNVLRMVKHLNTAMREVG